MEVEVETAARLAAVIITRRLRHHQSISPASQPASKAQLRNSCPCLSLSKAAAAFPLDTHNNSTTKGILLLLLSLNALQRRTQSRRCRTTRPPTSVPFSLAALQSPASTAQNFVVVFLFLSLARWLAGSVSFHLSLSDCSHQQSQSYPFFLLIAVHYITSLIPHLTLAILFLIPLLILFGPESKAKHSQSV